MNQAIVTIDRSMGTDATIKVFPVIYADWNEEVVCSQAMKDEKILVVSYFSVRDVMKRGCFCKKLFFAATDEQYQNIRTTIRNVESVGIVESRNPIEPIL